MSKEFYVYILRCGDGSLYTGYTDDLPQRLQKHQSGKGGKYTRSHLPVELVYSEKCEDKSQAMSREYHIKAMTKQAKEQLISPK